MTDTAIASSDVVESLRLTYQGIPAWLSPYKNSWLTIPELSKIMAIDFSEKGLKDAPKIATWVYDNKESITHTSSPAHNGKGMSRRYLVKKVWTHRFRASADQGRSLLRQ